MKRLTAERRWGSGGRLCDLPERYVLPAAQPTATVKRLRGRRGRTRRRGSVVVVIVASSKRRRDERRAEYDSEYDLTVTAGSVPFCVTKS